jgi:ankyrin repeat protein
LIQEDYEQLSRAPKAFIPKPVDEAPFKQLHEICSLPSLSLEMIRIFINTYPLSVRQKDMNGDLPLHVAIRREEPADLVVCELLRKYPQSAFVKDHHGNLPLFMACVRSKVSAKIIKGLLVANPQAASTKVYGSFALHALVHTGGVTPQTIKLLLAANPEGVHTPNNFGNLPLHYLCAHDSPNIDCLRILLEAYPEGITCMNKIGDTPISRALSQTSRTDTEEVRDSMRLLLRSALQSTPSVLSEEQRKTLRQLNWEARRNIVMMCANNAAAPRSESRLALAEISSGITGVWRNILEFL